MLMHANRLTTRAQAAVSIDENYADAKNNAEAARSVLKVHKGLGFRV